MEDIKSTLQKLKPFIGKKADALWVRYNTGDKIEKQEWEQVINLLVQKYRIDSVEEDIVLRPPPKDELLGQVTIGKTQYLNHPSQEFGLNFSELTRHLGIFGSTGTGKTTLAKNILRELIQHKIPFIVFDWGDTKTGEARHVYFNMAVRNILERIGKVRPISHRFVFTYHGNPVKSIKYSLTEALKKTGIQNFRFHDLRRTYVSNARKAGIDRTVIMKLTGHKTLSMFTCYNTVDEADAKQALNLMEGHLANTGQPTTAILPQAQKRG